MVFCTSLGKPGECNQDSLLITIPAAMVREDVSANSDLERHPCN